MFCPGQFLEKSKYPFPNLFIHTQDISKCKYLCLYVNVSELNAQIYIMR